MSKQQSRAMVRCGDCAHFVRDGKCRFFDTFEGKAKDRPFAYAPFWVWSDCYSDKEQVRANVKTMCATFAERATPNATKD
jgi:hypothetical protein